MEKGEGEEEEGVCCDSQLVTHSMDTLRVHGTKEHSTLIPSHCPTSLALSLTHSLTPTLPHSLTRLLMHTVSSLTDGVEDRVLNCECGRKPFG